MKTRILTGILFTLGVLLLTLPGIFWSEFPLLFVALVGALVSYELWKLVQRKYPEQGYIPFGVGLGLIFLPRLLALLLEPTPTLNFQSSWGFLAPLGGALILDVLLAGCGILYFVLRRDFAALPQAWAVLLAELYLILPLSFAPILLLRKIDGCFWLLLALFSPWFSDVFAYFTGCAFGKRKILPRLSPKKTAAGFLGGLIGPVVLVLVLWSSSFLPVLNVSASLCLPIWIFLALVLGLLSQFGDWFASAIKRQTGIKDFGHCFPGHGGALDRFDSVFFTLPVILLFVWVFGI